MKYGNRITSKCQSNITAASDLSSLPDIIRPWQYTCGSTTNGYLSHSNLDNHSHSIEGFIQDSLMAYLIRFTGNFESSANAYPFTTSIYKRFISKSELNTRSPFIFKSDLISKTKIFELTNYTSQNISFSFSDYDIRVYNETNSSDITDLGFFLYYYPTQALYFIIESVDEHNIVESVTAFFTPIVELNGYSGKLDIINNSQKSNTTIYLEKKDGADNVFISINPLLKDISHYNLYVGSAKLDWKYVKEIRYPYDLDLNHKQIGYYTLGLTKSEYNLTDSDNKRIVEIEFYPNTFADNEPNPRNLSLVYVYDKDKDYITNNVSDNSYSGKVYPPFGGNIIPRETGAKYFIKVVSKISNANTFKAKSDTLLIADILYSELLVGQDYKYFDIGHSSIYFKNKNSYPTVDREKVSKDTAIFIEYYLNDTSNGLSSTGVSGYIEFANTSLYDKSAISNISNYNFYSYDDTFESIGSDANANAVTQAVFFDSRENREVPNGVDGSFTLTDGGLLPYADSDIDSGATTAKTAVKTLSTNIKKAYSSEDTFLEELYAFTKDGLDDYAEYVRALVSFSNQSIDDGISFGSAIRLINVEAYQVTDPGNSYIGINIRKKNNVTYAENLKYALCEIEYLNSLPSFENTIFKNNTNKSGIQIDIGSQLNVSPFIFYLGSFNNIAKFIIPLEYLTANIISEAYDYSILLLLDRQYTVRIAGFY